MTRVCMSDDLLHPVCGRCDQLQQSRGSGSGSLHQLQIRLGEPSECATEVSRCVFILYISFHRQAVSTWHARRKLTEIDTCISAPRGATPSLAFLSMATNVSIVSKKHSETSLRGGTCVKSLSRWCSNFGSPQKMHPNAPIPRLFQKLRPFTRRDGAP